jgi:flagellar biosynthesis/type III secretory pathway chaperone
MTRTLNTPSQLAADLRAHQAICRELLLLAERECHILSQGQTAAFPEIAQSRRALLPRLKESLETVRRHRLHWQSLAPAERAAHPEINFLVRQVQDLTMRVILLDRENEQGLLRRGLIPPREIPSANQRRPHFVTDLYRRQRAGDPTVS